MTFHNGTKAAMGVEVEFVDTPGKLTILLAPGESVEVKRGSIASVDWLVEKVDREDR